MYVALVKVVETESGDGSTSSGGGRKKNKAYPFGAGIGIENNYHQVFRSKQLTPKFTRNPPPPPKRMPQPPLDLDESDAGYEDQRETYEHELDTWRKKADRFAHFYLTMFRPEDTLYEKGQICAYKYNIEAFHEFYDELVIGHEDGFLFPALRLELIDRMIYSWRVDRDKREMLSAHRARARTLWSAEEKEVNKMVFGGNLGPIKNDDGDGMDYITDPIQDLSHKESTDARKHLSHSGAILSTLDNMAETSIDTTNGSGSSVGKSANTGISSVANVSTLPFNLDLDESKRVSKVKDIPRCEDGKTPQTPNKYRKIPDLDKKVEDFIKSQDLSADKEIVVKLSCDHFKAIRSGMIKDDDYEAPQLLVCGKPGNGKSKIIETLDGVVSIMKVGELMKNAYMGSAAVNIRGTTLLKS
jgi:hypothetical protein